MSDQTDHAPAFCSAYDDIGAALCDLPTAFNERPVPNAHTAPRAEEANILLTIEERMIHTI